MTRRASLTLIACLAVSCATGRDQLSIGENEWVPKLFNLDGVPEEQAARFELAEDSDYGACLAVGRWRAGRHNARYETAKPLTLLEGQVRGMYRTEDLLPFTAAVYVAFHAPEGRRRVDTFDLAPSPSWKEFRFPIRRPPPGATGVSLGFGLSEKTDGRAVFTRLSVSAEPFQAEFPESPGEVTRADPPPRLPPAPHFRLTEHDGTWWLVTPQGRPFYSTGTDGPYFDTAEPGMAAGRGYLDVMRTLGFNSLAGWTYVPGWAALNDAVVKEGGQPLAMFRSLESGASKAAFDRLEEGGHGFPDPFDPRWEPALRERVRQLAARVNDRPWFVSLFADNEVNHRELYRRVWTPNCSAALRAFLEKKYGEIDSLNRAWGASYESFDDLIRSKPDPVLRHGPMYEDFFLFSRELVRRYAETTARVIREEMPGHLACSNRFMLDDVTWWLDYLDLYAGFDIIPVNMYPANLSPGLNDNERMILEMVHEKTGKPILIPEWSVPALDSGLYANPDRLDWSYDEAVDTQTQRARQAAKVVIDQYNLPFVVGAHWFIWRDFDSEKRQANRGLFKASGEPWTELQEALRRAYRLINTGSS